MAKIKKYQQVEIYLNKLLQRDDFDLQDLEDLNYKDISDSAELEGIGDRTISNVLTAFKLKKGIDLPEKKVTKKKLVEDYLTNMLDSGKISEEELNHLCYNDLKDVEELAGVGKTTITCTLAEFKQCNDKDLFEMGVLDFLASEKASEEEVEEEVEEEEKVYEPAETVASMISSDHLSTSDLPLSNDNVQLIKKMINEFKQLKNIDEEKKIYELRELKHALHFVGINPTKIVRLYWEDVSKDFMNRKILSGKTVFPADSRISSFM